MMQVDQAKEKDWRITEGQRESGEL